VPNKLREIFGDFYMWESILKNDMETFSVKVKELYDMANSVKGQIPQEAQDEFEKGAIAPLKQMLMKFEGGFARLNFEESNA
tara:strand:- start:496 stop:741 length:246 start_codon:yes stop_codon:yes gene_type:complete